MEHEQTGRRPSRLSPVFRRHSLGVGDGGTGRLRNWTRHVDGDWLWYCANCGAIVIFAEEKKDDAKEKAWNVTRRAAFGHSARPWAWLVVTHEGGEYTVTRARLSDQEHETFGPERVDEEALITWIEQAFATHYEAAGHPPGLVPERLRGDAT